ncbi:MAG: S8 family peptidase [Ignavibacteria bacterium]|nr:S8 family peptidase [Ignavibacteria bacterium]
MKITLLLIVLTTLTTFAGQKRATTSPAFMANVINVRMKSSTSFEDVKKTLSPFGAVPIRQMLQPIQSITFSTQSTLRSSNSPTNLNEIIAAESPVLRTFVVQFTAVQTPQKFCAYLMKNCKDVEIAEPSIIERTTSKPNDAFASQQDLLSVIKAFEAWDISKGDATVVIGICDNGIYQNHEDLTNSIAINTGEIPDNGIDDDQNGVIDDYRGANITALEDASKHGDTFCSDDHGSCVAGIAGATANNSIGIAGVGYNCKIFPIKTGFVSKSDVYAGYEGLIYAAVRGFKVVNCSWGSPNSYSKINESIIRYVQSRDVAIVVAAGNNTGIVPWYPAGYAGVLGVGETDIAENAPFMSAIGSHSKIMAPGNSSFATTNQQGGYTQSFGGSSASAPIVAGVVGIVRAHFPNLSAEQALEHVRLTADNIETQNPDLKGIIAGRVNMLKAVTVQPLSHPALKLLSWDLQTHGRSTSQFFAGDTVSLTVDVLNILSATGASTEFITATLSVKDQFFPFQLLDSIITVPSIGGNSGATFSTFRFVIPEENSELTFLRINFKSSNYNDYLLIPFHPTSDIATFRNDSISVSLGDQGQFGFAGQGVTWHGTGLSYSDYGNVLYFDGGSAPDHCFIVTDGDNRVVSASVNESDFITLKQFTAPEPNVNIMSDTLVDISSRIGVEVKRTIAMAPNNCPAFKIQYNVKNVSGSTIKDISIGQYLDVDIGAYGIFNYARPFNEAVPTGITGAAEILGRDGSFDLGGGRTGTHAMIGCLVYSISPGGVPQMAGVIVTDSLPNGLTAERKIALINSGTSMQPTYKGDVGLASGMKFPGNFPAGESRIFEVCYGAGMTKEALAQSLLKCAQINSVKDETANTNQNWTVQPNPVNDEVTLISRHPTPVPVTVRLFTSFGQSVSTTETQNNPTVLSTKDIPSGVYYIVVDSGVTKEFLQIIVVH